LDDLTHLLEEVWREEVCQRPVVVVRVGHAAVVHRGDVMDLVGEVGPGVCSRGGRHLDEPWTWVSTRELEQDGLALTGIFARSLALFCGNEQGGIYREKEVAKE
jgi:hypothetical protein